MIYRTILITTAILCLLSSSLAFGNSLRDARGKSFDLKKKPRRIVSASLASDEILIALLSGKERSRLYGVSKFVDDPRYSNVLKEANSIPARIGTDLEHIVSLKPDLAILASYNRPEILRTLEKAKVRVFVLQATKSFQDISENIITIGKLVFAHDKSIILNKEFKRQLNAIRSRAIFKKPPRVINYSQELSITGAKTTFHDVITYAGGQNIGSLLGITGWATLSAEKILTSKPDFIIAAANASDAKDIKHVVSRAPVWKSLGAAKKNHIIAIPAHELYSVSHHVTKALIKVQKAFHDNAKFR